MACSGGGFERFALIRIFAGGGDRVDEGIAVGDDQAADDPCRDFVRAKLLLFLWPNDTSDGRKSGGPVSSIVVGVA